MERIKKIIVSIQFSEKEIEVGELIEDSGQIFFKYYLNFIKMGLEISPFRLPLNREINKAEKIPFDKLFGVFNDSLPDGWGRLLLDRKLIAAGILPTDVSPLDRLAYVGSNGMGALIYRPEKDKNIEKKGILDLDEIASKLDGVYEGTSIEIIEKFYDLGGSSGGARPKIFVQYDRQNDQLVYGGKQLNDENEYWIIKFPSTTDFFDIAEIEFAYYKMALDAGIKMNESSLFSGPSGKKYFGTKRFDREGNNKIHMHSACGLLHDNFRMSTMDYGRLMDAAFNLVKDFRVYEEVLRLAAFNIYTHNRDDHSKNFSFLMNQNGNWQFSPAYDLTFSNSSHGMHSTLVAGEGEYPGEKQLKELAKEFGVKNIEDIIKKVKLTCANWMDYAKEANVSSNTAKLINKKIKTLLKN